MHGAKRMQCCTRRLPGERTDVWVVRHNSLSARPWGGFHDLGVQEVAEVLAAAKAVVFLGGPAEDAALALNPYRHLLPGAPPHWGGEA